MLNFLSVCLRHTLDAPVTARCVGEGFRIGDTLRADVERSLGRCLAVDLARALYHAYASQLRPVLPDRRAIA
jgi:hypothetical protein